MFGLITEQLSLRCRLDVICFPGHWFGNKYWNIYTYWLRRPWAFVTNLSLKQISGLLKTHGVVETFPPGRIETISWFISLPHYVCTDASRFRSSLQCLHKKKLSDFPHAYKDYTPSLVPQTSTTPTLIRKSTSLSSFTFLVSFFLYQKFLLLHSQFFYNTAERIESWIIS